MALLTLPNLLLYSIPLAALFVYVPYGVVALERVQLAQSMDDPMTVFAKPRTFNEKLPAYAQRANWAHQNSFESFVLYAPAALMAFVTEQTGTAVLVAAVAYLAGRLLFSLFYILNVPPLRSLMFGIGSLSIFTLYVLSCRSIWLA